MELLKLAFSAAALALSIVAVAHTWWHRVSSRRSEQVAEVLRFHERWWGPDFLPLRESVFEYMHKWEVQGSEMPLIASYKSRSGCEDERRNVGRLAYFFADLEAVIDEGLASERFAYRLFGESQFFWFSPFLLAVAEAALEGARDDFDEQRWRWIPGVKALNCRFERIRAESDPA